MSEHQPPDDPFRTKLVELPTVPGTTPAHPSPPAGPAVGHLLAGYDVLEEVGRGGMGVVYRARDTRLNRDVALKVIIGGPHAGPGELARFKTEAEAVARLNHPGIVQIYEVGEHDGHPFIAIELCPGGNLAQRLQGRPLPPREAAALVARLADAVHAAHQANVVHRDLKPANVLLTGDGSPKVTDFGLAKMLDDDSGRTHSGAVIGTPSYMAPEQARGLAKGISPSADVWALGAILYECLTGRPPFLAATSYDTMAQVVTEEPVPPRQLNVALPADLETVCLKCLHKEPARRYESAQALADDLNRWLRGEPIAARPVGQLERSAKWVRRNPAVSALAALAFLAMAIGAVTSWLFYLGAAEQARLATERGDELAAEKGKSDEHLRKVSFLAYALQVREAQQNLRQGRPTDAEATLRLYDGSPRWEHSYLSRQARKLVWRKKDTAVGSLSGATFSPDGRWVATMPQCFRVLVCDAVTGREALTIQSEDPILVAQAAVLAWGGPRTLPLSAKLVTSGIPSSHYLPVPTLHDFGFSGDGREVLTVGSGYRNGRECCTILAWDVRTGRRTFHHSLSEPPDNLVYSARFSPGGHRLALWTKRGLVILDVRTGKRRIVYKIAPDEDGIELRPEGMCFSADGGLIAVRPVNQNGVLVCDVQTGREVRAFHTPGTQVGSVALRPDGRRVAVGTIDGAVYAWDIRTGEEVFTARWDSCVARWLCFSPDGQALAAPAFEASRVGDAVGVRVADARTGADLYQLRVGFTDGGPARVSYGPDGTRMAVGSNDQELSVWDARPGEQPLRLQFQGEHAFLAFNADGTRLATAGEALQLWDTRTGREVLNRPNQLPVALASRPDGVRVVSGWKRGEPLRHLRGWEAHAGRQEASLIKLPPGKNIHKVRLSPEGEQLVTRCEDGTVRVMEVQTGKELGRFTVPWTAESEVGRDEVNRLGLGPGGRLVAWSDHRETVRLLDVKTGRDLHTLRGHTRNAQSLCFSADGARLACGCGDGTIKVWDVETGEAIFTLKGHHGGVSCLCFSPDGKRLASACGSIKLWDMETGQEALTLEVPGGRLRFVCFSPDGHRLAATGAGAAWVWDGRPLR